jgi:hypothetical protein
MEKRQQIGDFFLDHCKPTHSLRNTARL